MTMLMKMTTKMIIITQVWILHNSEPPYSIYVDLRLLNNVFNWTSWYRTDADIFSPYGDYVEKSNAFDEDSGEYFTMPNLASDDRNDNEDDEEDSEDPKQVMKASLCLCCHLHRKEPG